jgi:hypothetical protein
VRRIFAPVDRSLLPFAWQHGISTPEGNVFDAQRLACIFPGSTVRTGHCSRTSSPY